MRYERTFLECALCGSYFGQNVCVQSSLVLSIAVSLPAKHRGSSKLQAASGLRASFHVRNACGSNSATSRFSFWPKQGKIIIVYLTGKAIKTYLITPLDRPLGHQEVEAARISRQSVHEGGKVLSPAH
jgi:hypothetical protein